MRMRGVSSEQAIREEATKAETMKNSVYWLNLIACSGQPGAPAHTPQKPQRELTPLLCSREASSLAFVTPLSQGPPGLARRWSNGRGEEKINKEKEEDQRGERAQGSYKRLVQGLLDGLPALVTPPATKVLAASASVNICLRLSRVLTFFVPRFQFFIIL